MRGYPSLRSIGQSVRSLVARPATELDPKEAYDLWSATYDDTRDNALLYAEAAAVRPLVKCANLREKSVLDAGCGTGRNFQTILDEQPKLLAGVDISENMLERAGKKIPTTTQPFLNIARVESLPFRDQAFDLVISTLVLDHVEELANALHELARVLANGGFLIVSSFHPFGKLLSWKRTFRAEGSWFNARYYLHLYSDYFDALQSAGMEILRLHEPVIDWSLKPFYERAGRLDIYERFQGYPLLLVLLARKK